jgi:hypothetical protein
MLRRCCVGQNAIIAGVDPAALVEVMNQAQAERAAAKAEVDRAPVSAEVSRAEVYAMIDSLGDVGAVIKDAKPAGLYQKLDLQLVYIAEEQAVYATSCSRAESACARLREGCIRSVTVSSNHTWRLHPHALRHARCAGDAWTVGATLTSIGVKADDMSSDAGHR